jgi:predicted nucleic acid-binding Zn ribbon protein
MKTQYKTSKCPPNAYTYYLYHIPTQVHYYGCRYAVGCDPNDLGITYFSSSTKVHKLIELYGKDSFTYEVRKIFGNEPIMAQEYEKKVLRRLKVLYRDNWLNDNIGGIFNLTRVQIEQKVHKQKNTIAKNKQIIADTGINPRARTGLCANCGVDILKRRKYCSKRCAGVSNGAIRGNLSKEKAKLAHITTCFTCNKAKTPSKGKFCSKKCRYLTSTLPIKVISQQRHNEVIIQSQIYNKNPKSCTICQKDLSYDQFSWGNLTCGNACGNILKMQEVLESYYLNPKVCKRCSTVLLQQTVTSYKNRRYCDSCKDKRQEPVLISRPNFYCEAL